jgi:O-antigen/teichoic acid export membrane protein
MQSLAETLRSRLASLRSNPLARNAGWMLIGQGLSLLLQVGYFILLARFLGVREYGVFVGASAFVGIAMPYSTIGSGVLFMRYVGAQNDSYAAFWGNILLSTAIGGSVLTVLLSILAPHLLNPASASIVFLVSVGNCIFSQLVGSMGFVFQAFDRLKMTAMLNILTNCLRLLAVGIMRLLLARATAQQWACVSLYISLFAAIIGYLIVTGRYGRPRFVPKMLVSYGVEGLGFSFGWSAQSIYNDIDKTLLSHYSMNSQNGIYTMAYRVVDVATIPISALDAAALSRYFRESAMDIHKVPAFAFRLAVRASLIGLFISMTLFFAAPIIPYLVGRGFSESTAALRWLSLLPAIRGVHQLTGCALTGMGFQRLRTIAQFSAAGLNLALNLWLIPHYSWHGAAWASLATDASLAIANCLILRGL